MELHRDQDLDEDVVLGLGLDLYVELLHPQVDVARHPLDERQLEVWPGFGDPGELAQPLQDGGGLLLHGVENR